MDLIGAARRAGFVDAAVARVHDDNPGEVAYLRALEAGHLAPFDAWMNRARADLRARYPFAKSVLVVVENYYAGDHLYGEGLKVSRYAWNRDYHRTMRKRLRKIRTEAVRAFATEVSIFNDVDPVLERAWAVRAGLGFIGKSGMFIHRRFGTWTFLGGLVLGVELEPSARPQMPDCGTCTACIEACPVDAIVGCGEVDARRCLTTWSIEKPLEDEAQNKATHGWAAGCDVCQEVCPWNRFQTLTDRAQYQPEIARVRAGEVDALDIKGTPLARAGHSGLAATLQRAKTFG